MRFDPVRFGLSTNTIYSQVHCEPTIEPNLWTDRTKPNCYSKLNWTSLFGIENSVQFGWIEILLTPLCRSSTPSVSRCLGWSRLIIIMSTSCRSRLRRSHLILYILVVRIRRMSLASCVNYGGVWRIWQMCKLASPIKFLMHLVIPCNIEILWESSNNAWCTMLSTRINFST